jgi:hypothetical protein
MTCDIGDSDDVSRFPVVCMDLECSERHATAPEDMDPPRVCNAFPLFLCTLRTISGDPDVHSSQLASADHLVLDLVMILVIVGLSPGCS